MELDALLQQIDSLKKEAAALQPVKPEYERVFWEKFRLEFNYNSNHMEGNTMTYGHTQILLKSGDVVGKYNIRELQEMKAHDLALKIIRESAENPEFVLTQKFIREINQIILVEPYYNEAITEDGRPTQKLIIPGEYKKTPNSVRLPNGEMFFYPSPEETPALMSDLIEWYNKESTAAGLHPIHIAALMHYKLVRIHPFDDSNGRTSRLLMNFVLLKYGYAPVVIESADKKNYLIALNEADAGDIGAFVNYIITLSLKWQELFTRAAKGEEITEKGDFEKEVELLKRNIDLDKKPKVKKTGQAVNEIIETSIFPLFDKLSNTLSKFDDFFYAKEISFEINNKLVDFKDFDNLPELYKKTAGETNNITTFLIHYYFRGFSKSNNDVTDMYISLQIIFLEYVFEIRFVNQNSILIRKKYGQQLTGDEIEMIAEKAGRKILEDIKNYSENK